MTHLTTFWWPHLSSLLSTLLKYTTSVTYRDIVYKLKPKVILTLVSTFLNNTNHLDF